MTTTALPSDTREFLGMGNGQPAPSFEPRDPSFGRREDAAPFPMPGNPQNVDLDSFDDKTRKERASVFRAAAQELFRTDVTKLDDAGAWGLYHAVTESMFGLADEDGSVAFGKRAAKDPRQNIDMLRRFVKGEYTLIEDPEYTKWREMNDEEKFKYALESETIGEKVKSNLKGERGASFWEMAAMSGMSSAPGMQLPAEERRDIVRRSNYETLTDEEKEKYRADVVADYDEKLSRRQTLATFLQFSQGLSDRASWMLAKSFNDGVPDSNIETLPEDERDRVYSAFSLMRGDQKSGTLLFVPTDFTDNTKINRVQLGLYGLQQSVLGLFTDTWGMAKDAALAAYAKTALSESERKDFFDWWNAQARMEQAMKQNLPEAESFFGEAFQGVAENLHWFIPYSMIGKGGKMVTAARGLKEADVTLKGWKKVFQPLKDLQIMLRPMPLGGTLKGEKTMAEASKAIAEAQVAATKAAYTLDINGVKKLGDYGKTLVARQMAAVEHFTQTLRGIDKDLNAAKWWKDAAGTGMWAVGEAQAFSAFASEYVANADAAGISREESVLTAAAIGLINAKIEKLYVPGLEVSLSPAQIKSLTFVAMAQAIRSDGAAGFRKWLANRVAYGVKEGMRVAATEGLVEEPLQQMAIEHGKAFDKLCQELRENGDATAANEAKALWNSIVATLPQDYATFIDTAADMLPSSIGFGVTTIGNMTRRQHIQNVMVRHANRRAGSTSTMGTAQSMEELMGATDYDAGVVDVIQRAWGVRNAMEQHWQGEGGEGQNNPHRFEEAITAARQAFRNSQGGDVVREVAQAAGVDVKTAEVLTQYLQVETEAAAFSPTVRAMTALNMSLADIDEQTIKTILPGYVEGSFAADPEAGVYSGKVKLADGSERTIAYKVGDISEELMKQAEVNSKVNSAFGRSWDARIEENNSRGIVDGAIAADMTRKWAELSDQERYTAAVRAQASVNGFSSGTSGVFELTDARGEKVRVNADDIIYLASGRIADIGYGAAATQGTVRHETFHSLWRFARASLDDADVQALAKTLGVDVTKDGWEVELDEKMAHQMERYASGHYVSHAVSSRFDKMLDGWAGKLVNFFGKIGQRDEVLDPNTGKPYQLKNLYDRVLRGELGSGALGVELAKIPEQPAGEAATTKSAMPVEVTDAERAAVEEEMRQGVDESGKSDEKFVHPESVQTRAETATVDEKKDGAQKLVHSSVPVATSENPADASTPNQRYYRVGLPNSNVKLVGRLEVRDAETGLVTSTDADYHDRGNQNRDDKSEESRALVEKIGANPDPLQVGTVQPIASNGIVWALPNGDVIIGNHRVNGVRLGYEKRTTGELEKFVREDAARRGIEIGENVKKPITVFVLERIESPDGKADVHEVVRLANESQNRGFNVREQAANDAKIIVDNNLLPRMVFRADGRIDETKSGDAIGKFRQETGAQGMIAEDGSLTEEGQTRIQNAALAALLGRGENAALLQKIMANAGRLDMQNELRALMKMTPELMSLAEAKPAYDLRGPLAEALQLFTEWRDKDETARVEKGKTRHDWRETAKDGHRLRGVSWEQFMSQGDMFRKPSDEAKILGDLFARAEAERSFDREDVESAVGKKRAIDLVSNYLTDYIENARAVNTETEDIFGGAPASRAEVMAAQRVSPAGGVRFSVDPAKVRPATKEEYNAALSTWGDMKIDTGNVASAGWIFPDGRVLKPKMQRTAFGMTPHHDSLFAFLERPERSNEVEKFEYGYADSLAGGAVRLNLGNGGIEVMRLPTAEQLDTLYDALDAGYGLMEDEGEDVLRVDVDRENGAVAFTAQYRRGTSARRIMDDLREWFESAKVPDAAANARFSISGIYTGSAADYDKPSLHYVGSGEGSQVYGWGLYGSNVRGVAESYAASAKRNKAITQDEETFQAVKKVLGKSVSEDILQAIYEGVTGNSDWGEVKAWIKRDAEWDDEIGPEMLSVFRKKESELKKVHEQYAAHEQIYEQTWFTNREPGDESHLLKWYEPVSEEQLKWIRDALVKEKNIRDYSKTGYGNVLVALEHYLNVYSLEGDTRGITGETVYKAIDNVVDKDPKAASEFLYRAGIDGVKYPVDSFGAKTVKNGDEAGWNYVAFSDEHIRVDHKWTDGQQRFSITAPYDPRSKVPAVRGGWNEKKILRYLKANPSLHGTRTAARLISEFDTVDELKDHMFYHGTRNFVDSMQPSITKSDRWAQEHGGGGYGQRYWGISVSKSKKIASNFGNPSPGVSIYPVVLAKGAKVIDRPDLTDAADVEDHIVELWNDGVDAVRLGDWSKDTSEQELLVLNPRAICNIGTADNYRYFKLGSPENPLDIKDDAHIARMLEAAKDYAEYSPAKRFGKPLPPSMFKDGTNELKPKEVRDAEREQYRKDLAAWQESDQGMAAAEYEWNMRDAMRFSIGGIYTGTAANYANRSRRGGVDDGPSLKKIGTGEGSQVYGWGLYGSTVRGVAEGYADNGSRMKHEIIHNGKTVQRVPNPTTAKELAESEMISAGDVKSAASSLAYAAKFKKGKEKTLYTAAAKYATEHADEYKQAGSHLYEQTFFTDRAPGDEGHLLKWYEPVSEEQLKWVRDQANKEGLVLSFSRKKAGKTYTGGDLYKDLEFDLGGIRWGERVENPMREASEFLYRAGIDGVKYPVDSYGGKGVKDGDKAGWNYVSFRDDNIRVDHKWTDGQQRFSIYAAGKYAGSLRSLAHGIKEGDEDAIAESAGRMVALVPNNAVLVPIPGHLGRARTTMRLAQAIAALKPGVSVVDALEAEPHESNYDQKKRLHKPPKDVNMWRRAGVEIPEGRPVYFVDNVVASGSTYYAAQKAIPGADIITLADTMKQMARELPTLDEIDAISKQKKAALQGWREKYEANHTEKNFDSYTKAFSEYVDAVAAAYDSRHPDETVPHGRNKVAGVVYPDAGGEIENIRFSIGAKRRGEYTRILGKYRPDLRADAIIGELEKFGDTKKEKVALHWIVSGGLELPADAYKVDDAISVAEKAKVDPFKYRSPDELMLANKEFKPSAKPIDPDTVPELSDKRDESDGVVSYQVQDNRAGQAAMRRIIDTHWGEDANPWCLLAREKKAPILTRDFWQWMYARHDGNTFKASQAFTANPIDWRDRYEKETGHSSIETPDPMASAWDYWENTYNALPKRVAFKDGKLLAFMATAGYQKGSEYDGQMGYLDDQLAEQHPTQFEEYNQWLEKHGEDGDYANFYEWLDREYPEYILHAGDDPQEEWWDRRDKSHTGPNALREIANPGVRYSVSSDLVDAMRRRAAEGDGQRYSINPNLRADIDRALAKRTEAMPETRQMKRREEIVFSDNLPLFGVLGLPDMRVVCDASHLRKINRDHRLTAEQMADLPNRYNEPVAVFRDGERAFTILTDMTSLNNAGEMKSVMIRMTEEVRKNGERLFVASAYSRESDKEYEYARLVNTPGAAVFYDKDKAANLMLEEGTKSTLRTLATRGDVVTPEGLTVHSIPQTVAPAQGSRFSVEPPGFKYPNPLNALSDDELIAAAVAARMALGKSDKISDRAIKINTVQQLMRRLHPDWTDTDIGRESNRIVSDARKLGKKIREDLDRGVSESLILEHLPDAAREQFGREMREEARKGQRLGVFAQRVKGEIEERQARMIDDAVRVQTGLDAANIENAYGINLSETIMHLAENPLAEKPPQTMNGSAGEESAAAAEGSEGESAEGAAEIDAKVKAAVNDILAASRTAAEADERNRKDRRAAAGRAEERKAEAGESGDEGSDAGDALGEGDFLVNAVKKEGVDLENPRHLARFVAELARRQWIKEHGLKQNAEVWRDLVAVQFLRKTAQSVYAKLCRDLTYSRGRETAMQHIARFDAAPTVAGLMSEMEFVGALINARRIRDTQQQKCEQIDLFLRERFGAQGRFKPDKEEGKRKVSAEAELRARYMRHAMWLTPDAAAEEARQLQETLNALSVDFKDAGRDVDQSREFVETIRRLNVLREFGALRYKPIGDIDAAAQWWEDFERGSSDDIVREMSDRDIRTKKAAHLLAVAFADPKRTTIREGGKADALNRFITGHMGFISLLQDCMRHASDADAAAVKDIIDYISREIQKSGDRSEAEKRRHNDAFHSAVEGIYGKSFNAVMKDMMAPDERFTKYMGVVGGKRVTPTKGRALQLLVSLLQEGRKVQVEDEKNPGQTKTVWEGGYHDNIVKHHREGQAAEIMRLLDPADMNMLKWLGQWYENNRADLSGVCHLLFGIGVYAELPNYFPVKMQLETQGLEKGNGVGWTIFPKALTPRVRNERDFDTSADIFSMWASRMEEAAQWKHHAQLGLEMRGIFGRAELREAIRANHGASVDELMQGFITDILAGHGAYDRSTAGVQYFSDQIRGWTALCALGGNVGVMAKQTTSIPAFGFEIGLVNTAKYMVNAFTPEGMAAMRRIWDSEQRRTRWQVGSSEAVRNALNQQGAGALKRMFQASMITNKLGDVVPALVVGQGIYRDCLARGMSEEDAMAETWSIVERTQQSGRMENQTSIQRRNKVGRIMFQFLSTQQQYLQYEVRAIREVIARPDSVKRWGNLGRAILLNHFILTSAYYWMGQLYKYALGQEPPEDELKDWIVTCLLGPYGSLFVAGFCCKYTLERAIKGYSIKGGSSMLPMESWLKNQVNDGAKLLEAIFDSDGDTWDNMLEAAGRWMSDSNSTVRDLRKLYRYRIKEEPQNRK